METYEQICDKCNSRGYLIQDCRGEKIGVLCDVCLGVGSLDWIQRIIGVKLSPNILKKRRRNSWKLNCEGIPVFNSYPRTKEEALVELRKKYREKLEKARELRKSLGDPIELTKKLME
jgi:hypothetical protein